MARRIPRTTEQLHRQTGSDLVARGLGLFSLALGAMELVGARPLARIMGMQGQENVIRAFGAREIAQGAAILMSRDPTPWVWLRVAGDGLDIASLAKEFAGGRARRDGYAFRNVAMALAAVAGVTALDLYNARTLSRENREPWSGPRDFGRRSGLPGRERPDRHGRGEASRGFTREQSFFAGNGGAPTRH